MDDARATILEQAVRSFNGRGEPGQMPQILGSPEVAVKAVNEFHRLGVLEETQQKYNELDFTSPEVMLNVKACVVGGTLARIVRDYRGQVDFLAVYLAEAHPKGGNAMGSKLSSLDQHSSLEERIIAAKDLLHIDADTHDCMTDDVTDVSQFRIVADQMDNLFSRMFQAHPDRVIFLHDGKLVYIGKNIIEHVQNPLRLMTNEARDWLEENVGPGMKK
ncbi:type II iodothyronine deiodinase-like isoform X2 [Lytechinus pictus]|uniref:type II iodothyronine deiodinase-like isoform X2 n=1 Tax=Lytechinus pictus TaxID=7653 RepID=UPI0030B9C257